MKAQRVLISGAGIAGLTLAFWLRRHGFEPRVIEAAPAPLARAAVQRLGLATAGQHFLLVWDASPDRSGLAPTVSILSV